MDEFASASGISRPTLSKYFTDPASVRASTRTRIEEAIRRTGFRPNLFARNVNRRTTNFVGIVVPQLIDPFFAALVQELEVLCTASGFHPIVMSSHGQPSAEARAVDTLLAMKAAGALVAPLGRPSGGDRFKALRKEMPVVFLDAVADAEGPFAGTDHAQSVPLMVEYLCRTGEPPVFLAMPDVNANAAARRDAYVAAMERRGLAPAIVEAGADPSWDFERIGYERMKDLIAGGLPGRVLLCANDRLAFGVVKAAFEGGLQVGIDGDIRVAGHDDHPLSRYIHPPLTTIAQDIAGVASTATALLAALIADDGGRELRGPHRSRLLPGRLVMRGSA